MRMVTVCVAGVEGYVLGTVTVRLYVVHGMSYVCDGEASSL